MDGPLLLYKAWLLSLIVIAVYRRFFETVGPRSEAFEAHAHGRPLLAALRGSDADIAGAVQRLRRRLAGKSKPAALLGGWPWPHYVLVLETAVAHRGASAVAGVTLARVAPRRTRQSSVDVLALLGDATLGLDVDVWVDAALRHPGRHPSPLGGYLLHHGPPGKPALEALPERPRWIDELGGGTAAARRHFMVQVPGSRSCSSSVNSALP